jgi:hypothetical protein
MSLPYPLRQYALVALLGMAVAACANQKDPAQKMISDIEAAVKAASPDASTYVPDQLVDVQTKLGTLKASFDKQDYKSVISAAPPVMSEAQSLASAAAAKKQALAKSLNDSWTTLSNTLPADANAIQGRIEFLSRPVNRKLAGGVDLDAATSGLADATSLWSKAKAAFAGGNLDEAVTMAKTAKSKLDGLAASLKLDFKEPAAVQDTSPEA